MSDLEDDDAPPLPSIMGRTPSGKIGDPLMRGLMASFSRAPDPSDFNSEHKRRERVYMWHRRWAMPTYERMKQQIEKTPGLDITVADLDLLPWRAGRLDNAGYHKIQRQAFLGQATMKRQQSIKKNDQAFLEAKAAQLQAEQAEKAEKEAQEKEKKRQERRKKAQEQAEAAAKEAEEAAAREAAEERRKQAEELARKAAQERLNQRRQQAPAVTNGDTPVERAYQWYDKLCQPTRDQMLKAVKMTKGMGLTAEDINTLPWNQDGTALDYPQLHHLLEQATGLTELPLKDEEASTEDKPAPLPTPSRQKENVGSSGKSRNGPAYFSPRSSKGMLHLSAADQQSLLASLSSDEMKMKRKAFGWYLTLGRPNKAVMAQILTHAKGISVSVKDLELLPWDLDGELFVQEHQMVLPSSDTEKQKKQLERRQREDAARAEEAEEFEEWKRTEQTPAPPVPPEHVRSGDVATAYRWFRNLGEPTKETFLAALSEAKGIPVTPEQVETLPWIKEDRALDHEHLTELLMQEEDDANVSAEDNKDVSIDPAILVAILKAYREYKALGIPKYITFTTLIEETTGLKTSTDDVALLPWDEDRLVVDEDRITELQNLLEEYLKQQKAQEAAKRKRAEERRKRRDALARQAQKAQEEKRRQQGAVEDEEAKKKERQTTVILKERMSLRELDFKRFKGDKKAWEESRALKAYAWYTRMSGPNRNQLKRIIMSMTECDVVPDDIDLLPWSPSGGWVDHVKIDELSARRKDVVY